MNNKLLIILLFGPLLVLSQASLVLNDDVYFVLNGGDATTPIYTVLDNGNTNALVTLGTGGGNLVSENEYNKLRWRIGTGTGDYVLPFTTGTNAKIPLSFNVSSAGAGGDHIDFSTYGTLSTEKWTPNLTPSMVTNLRRESDGDPNNSEGVIDRFWIFGDVTSYATRPDATISFIYDSDEVTGSLISAGAMVAQRFNTDDETWTGSFGSDDGSSVSSVVVDGPQLFEAWTLSSESSLLPVELTVFEATCAHDGVHIYWETASESNSSHFVIQKSFNGQNWFDYVEVQAVGNSVVNTRYEITDTDYQFTSTTYYRLKQVDINGAYVNYAPVSVVCEEGMPNLTDIILFPNPSNEDVNITFNSLIEGVAEARLIDQTGKIIAVYEHQLALGYNEVSINITDLQSAMYNLVFTTEEGDQYLRRLIKY